MKTIKLISGIALLMAGLLLATTKLYSQIKSDTGTTVLSATYPAAHNSGSLADFPKLHPLVVHVPIMCLLLAFLSQLISFVVFRRELSWVTLVLVIISFIGAYLASGIFHGGDPHLSLLDPVTRATFEKHAQFASYTVWISGMASVAKVISHFFLKRRIIPELIVLLLLAACSYTVAITADMGARLVHIDGVGVQGHYLPAHDNM